MRIDGRHSRRWVRCRHNVCVNVTGTNAAGNRPLGVNFDRDVLVSNVVSGAWWLAILAFASPWLSFVGALYVVPASLFLAAVYARTSLTRRQEAAAWVLPWLVALALWIWIAAGIERGTSGLVLTAWWGLVIATLCYVVWQLLALAIRRVLR